MQAWYLQAHQRRAFLSPHPQLHLMNRYIAEYPYPSLTSSLIQVVPVLDEMISSSINT